MAVDLTEPSPRFDRRALGNVGALASAQAILGSQLAIHITFAPLIGASIAPSPIWATAPISIVIIANMLVAAPVSLLHGRIGRRAGFLIGAVAGALGAALAAYAVLQNSFLLFMIASAFFGLYQTNQNLFRFAATETAPDALKPIAMSWVLAGGLLSALIAPWVATTFKDALAPVPLAGAYLGVVGLNVIGAVALLFVDIPNPTRAERAGVSSPGVVVAVSRMMANPDARTAVICGMISYALMTMVMTSTSAAMVSCGFGADDASWVIGAHVFAMFAPSFLTGPLIRRIGHRPVIAMGLALLAGCGVVALTGVAIEQFYIALILLGAGWNFAFIGASSLLTTTYRPEERAAVQGVNDTLVFGLMALASLGSGQIFHGFGWDAVNLAMTPFLIVAAATLALTTSRRAAA